MSTASGQRAADSATTLAAVDLGSNSFHLIVVRTEQDAFQVVDRMREMVQLGAGLDADNRLDKAARERALQCLERFGQRLRNLPRSRVRVVGTNTLRKARDTDDFIRKAESALGHPIEIISGIEEARLIYLGVSHSVPDPALRRLVVDIGGGSTELIIGERFEPIALESLYMGCVSMSQEYFGTGKIDKSSWRKAEVAAALEVETVVESYRELGWKQAVGASGTVRSIAKVLEAQGWSEGGITAGGLKKLRKAMLSDGDVSKLSLKELGKERAPVFPGGVVVLQSVFEVLGIEHMHVADGALREGLIYDQLGRIAHADVRERSVTALCARYNVDQQHSARVEHTAQRLFEQVAADWALQDEYYAHMLRWAARMHEIGLAIAHAQFHRHGAYIAANADLLGFSRRDQQLLSALISAHRRKISMPLFRTLPEPMSDSALRLVIILRLAVKLHRARSRLPLPEVSVSVHDTAMKVEFPSGWLAQHPLTAADLGREGDYLQGIGFRASYG